MTGRRADGYHELQTLFQFIDRSDRLRFYPAEDGQVGRRHALPGVPEANDLCLRAARTLAQVAGCRRGVVVELDKRLPLGGGLGGGSSDAATVLVALNRLWGTGLSLAELAARQASLGIDFRLLSGHAGHA